MSSQQARKLFSSLVANHFCCCSPASLFASIMQKGHKYYQFSRLRRSTASESLFIIVVNIEAIKMPKKQTFKQDDSFPTAEAANLISKQASCLSSSTMQSTVVQNNENFISYCCDYCGKTTGRLSLCRGCCRVWYCSLACHKKAWKGGHANTCGNVGNTAPVFLWDAWKFQQESLERAVAVADDDDDEHGRKRRRRYDVSTLP